MFIKEFLSLFSKQIIENQLPFPYIEIGEEGPKSIREKPEINDVKSKHGKQLTTDLKE